MKNLPDIESEVFDIMPNKKKTDHSPDQTLEHRGADIDYEDMNQVKTLMAKHLAKIFLATHKEKIRKELDNLKGKCS